MMTLRLPKANLGTLVEKQGRDEITYKLYLQGYQKVCNHHWKPIDARRVTVDGFKGTNTGCLFWGDRGVGKSQILTYLTAWAHEVNWVSLAITNHEEFVDASWPIFRWKNGLYLQKELAVRLLKDFGTSNAQICREFDVDLNVYGKCDISGVHDDEAEPCPRVWDEKRKVWSDAWKEAFYDNEVKSMQAKYDLMDYRLSDKLEAPQKLIDIVNYGIENPDAATNAFAEILHQLYKSDKY